MIYPRAHDLGGEFLANIIMHEWYFEHVEFLVHVILPVCFEKFCRGSQWNLYKIFSQISHQEQRMRTLQSLENRREFQEK